MFTLCKNAWRPVVCWTYVGQRGEAPRRHWRRPRHWSWTWTWGQIVRGAGGVIFVQDRPIQLPPAPLQFYFRKWLPDADCSASLGGPCPHPPSPPANHRGRGGVPCMQVAQRKGSQPRHVGEIPGVRGGWIIPLPWARSLMLPSPAGDVPHRYADSCGRGRP